MGFDKWFVGVVFMGIFLWSWLRYQFLSERLAAVA